MYPETKRALIKRINEINILEKKLQPILQQREKEFVLIKERRDDLLKQLKTLRLIREKIKEDSK